MEVALIVIFVLLGTAIGSFLNVCIDRLPAGKSLAYPPSHCDACQHRLSVIDLIPVFSYLWLHRRCRYCQSPIHQRIFWVELGTGLLFAFLYWHYGLSIELAVSIFYCCLFIVLGVIDLEHQLILNKITYPAIIVAVIISALQPQPGLVHVLMPWPEIANSVSGIINSLIGGMAGFVLFLILA
ncbi:prepilin peptidase, partial [Chloroflexota bacterium]